MNNKKKVSITLKVINVVLAAIQVYLQWKVIRERKQV
ncbi:hypothetical protein U271_01859 [Staphylococcus aureus F70893]|nr:hypothetical protein U271_01859 [Staphylococcus aureus F70893]EVX62705.1 hypothetical protein U280_02511 [Staphylococcus aureus F77047]EWW99077.1 hypothetical protein V308_01998 [Staphylococcus aureus H81433]